MAPQHGRASDRHRMEPLENAALQVVEQPEGGVGNAAGDRDEQDAGHQVVHIVVRARLDSAAEHVDEQQHEGDRHDRHRDDGVHAARDVPQGTPEHHIRVAEEMRIHRCSCMSLPTIARKISSNVGCRSTYSTFAGGSSLLSSSNVPDTMILPSCRIAIRSASFSASSRYWVVKNTVVPLCARSWITFHTSIRPSGSRPVVGSSRKMIRGSPMRLMAMSSRRRMPPE